MRTVVLCAVALLLPGCGADLLTTAVDPPGMRQRTFEGCLRNNGFLGPTESVSIPLVAIRFAHGFTATQEEPPNALPISDPGPIHKFLDCYIAKVDPQDLEGRLLRGHILVVLLAQYGTETLIVRDRSAKPQDATRLIADIGRAELALAAASPAAMAARYKVAFDGEAERQELRARAMLVDMPHFRNARRTAAILEIGIDIERVNSREFLYVAKSLFTAVTTKSITALTDVLQSVVQGLLIAMNVDWYGTAFLRDAQLALANPPAARNDVASWRMWDVRLRAACADLQSIAKSVADSCEPSIEAMLKYLRTEFGEDHPAIAKLEAVRARQAADAAAAAAKAAKEAADAAKMGN